MQGYIMYVYSDNPLQSVNFFWIGLNTLQLVRFISYAAKTKNVSLTGET